MEMVIAVLILIGAMVAGSTSSTSDEGRAESDPVTESEQTANCAPRRGHARTLPFPRRAAHPAGSDVTHCVDHNDFRREA